ncbi:Hypothetical protein HVR_LOCUS920 [uncultured virus]|nr:Hypothetical protein HVR_LOCUS920 [uncultured virus]
MGVDDFPGLKRIRPIPGVTVDTVVLNAFDVAAAIRNPYYLTKDPQIYLRELHEAGWKFLFFIDDILISEEEMNIIRDIEKQIPFTNEWIIGTIKPGTLVGMSPASFMIVNDNKRLDFNLARYSPQEIFS